MKIITLHTDFGLRDAYAAIMKGVILSLNPDAAIVDITHETEAQDVREAAFTVKEYYPWFPEGSIHVAVVDPTVGGARRPLVVAAHGHAFVGPDNGIFTLVMVGDFSAWQIENREFMLPRVSATFHGRDIFSPAAAHLSLGVDPSAFGGPVTDPVRLEDLFPEIDGAVLKGRIVRFDRFGNGITNISEDSLNGFLDGRPFRIETGSLSFDLIRKSYYEGEITCLAGSSGYMEFGYFRGSFREKTGASIEDEVRVIAL